MAYAENDISSQNRTDDVKINENLDFKRLYFSNELTKGITEAGFLKPSPIQLKAIPIGRVGCDLIVQAKTGTGKTLVFTVITLDKIDTTLDYLQALILAPTREIAFQIKDVVKKVGHFIQGLRVEFFVGGIKIEEDKEKAKDCHIAIGCPGRILHLIKKGYLSTDVVRLLVLDDADMLMLPGFLGDIEEIYSSCSSDKQVIACSATYPPDLLHFIGTYMRSAIHVTPEKETPSAKSGSLLLGIKQFLCILPHHTSFIAIMKGKEQSLLRLLSLIKFKQCIIFSNLHSRASSLCNMLRQKGYPTTFINSKMLQEDRFKAMNALKDQEIRVLVSSDLTSRGIDAVNVDLIINIDRAPSFETYLHRMGRAGRFGTYGIVITLVTEGEELTEFRKILSTSEISVLPYQSLNAGSLQDLWSVPMSIFPRITGIDEPAVSNLTKTLDSVNLNKGNKRDEANQVNLKEEDDSNHRSDYRESNNLKNVDCRCQKPNIDPQSVLEVTDDRLYAIKGKYQFPNQTITVCENRLPLNIPVAITKGKLIRFENVTEFTSEIVDLSYDISSLTKWLNEMTNKMTEPLKKENISDMVRYFSKIDTDSVNRVKSILDEKHKKEIKILKLCKLLKVNDLLGWMALDEDFNLIEDIKMDDTEIIKLNLIKCLDDKTHIEVIKFGNLDNFLLQDSCHVSECKYVYDITAVPELINFSFSDILNYFNGQIVGNKSNKSMVDEGTSNRKRSKKIKDSVKFNSIPTAVSHVVQNSTNENNLKYVSAENVKSKSSDKSSVIYSMSDLKWTPVEDVATQKLEPNVPVVMYSQESFQKIQAEDEQSEGDSETFSNVCCAEEFDTYDVEAYNSGVEYDYFNSNSAYSIPLSESRMNSVSEEFEQWLSFVQQERQKIEFEVYYSYMLDESNIY